MIIDTIISTLNLFSTFDFKLFHIRKKYGPEETAQTDERYSISLRNESEVKGLVEWPKANSHSPSLRKFVLHLVNSFPVSFIFQQTHAVEEGKVGKGSVAQLFGKSFENP